MSVSSGPIGASLTQEILSSLGLANKVLAVGTSEMRVFILQCCDCSCLTLEQSLSHKSQPQQSSLMCPLRGQEMLGKKKVETALER